MDMEKTGRLIRRLREERGITQKALAEKLNVTDKAVSKWERSLSCPDIALLSPLSEQLGISVAELLQGELGEHPTGGDAQNEHPEKSSVAGSKHPKLLFQKYALYICALLFLMGGGICVVCDWAVFGAFTWSLYPITALLFAWCVLFPLLRHGKKGLKGSAVSLSLAIFPFLFCLDHFLETPPLFLPIGIRMAAIGLAFLWGVYALCHIFSQRRLYALAMCALLAVLVCIAVNFSLSRLLHTPFLDEWDVLTAAVLLGLAAFLLRLDRKASRQHVNGANKAL